ncbi:hypothetical protein GQ55_1G013100 [Panicum hallii var. hallii]|uniref:Uncharacterized protein n=1 Tax=Panicum hallii var. hallii TaxID=1504633 RepID=A0A2T7F0Z2_9POAL|nr:hypothetical protein GQ55_1G013100 [Panicum hallii var. hallii]
MASSGKLKPLSDGTASFLRDYDVPATSAFLSSLRHCPVMERIETLIQATGPLVLRALCRRHLWAGRATEGAGREPRLLAEEHEAAGVGNQRCLRGGRSGRRSEPSLPAGGGREASGVQEWHDGTTGRQKR